MNWLGTVTGRVGYSFGQWLPYVKGGFAAADVTSPLQGAPTGGFSQGTELGGWTGGVGLEYQLSPKLSLGLEYLYTDLSTGLGGPPGGTPLTGSPEVYSTALKSQSLLGRLNYKAGWWGKPPAVTVPVRPTDARPRNSRRSSRFDVRARLRAAARVPDRAPRSLRSCSAARAWPRQSRRTACRSSRRG